MQGDRPAWRAGEDHHRQEWRKHRGNRELQFRQDAEVELRQVKYLNNVVEQDHRAVKRQVRPMMGFKSFWSAAVTLAGIDLMHMLRKGQLKATGRLGPAQQFYSLAT